MIDMKQIENDLYASGKEKILGIDEAGRGPWAGPLVVAGVVFPKDFEDTRINDSKKLKESLRDELFEVIKDNALSYSIKVGDAEFVDKYDPKNGTRKLMNEIIDELDHDYSIIDGEDLKLENSLQVIKGDSKSQTIAAASILAKVTRDRIMKEYDLKYPEYGFANHKGYGTKKHKEALDKYGITPIHRKSYKPVIAVIKKEV